MIEATNFYLKSAKEAFGALKARDKGLSKEDTAKRLGQ